MRKGTKLAAFLCAVASALSFGSSSVYAEGKSFADMETVEKMPIINRDTAKLTVRYFDDSEETQPVEGAEFTIYRVAKFGYDILAGNSGGYIPLADNLFFEDKDDPIAYEKTVISEYEKGLEEGYKATAAVNAQGEAVFDNIPVGAYLVTETKTMRYHVRSTSFLVSVPEMNETHDGWNFDVKCNPKQILAGDLNVTKKTKGTIGKKDRTYSIIVHLSADGVYKAKMPDGTDGTVKDGQTVPIKAGQTLYIYDIPAKTEFKVEEKEANGPEFDTKYTNQTGTVVSYGGVGVTVLNDSTRQDTGVYGRPAAFAIAGGAALALVILLITKHRDSKAEKNSNG